MNVYAVHVSYMHVPFLDGESHNPFAEYRLKTAHNNHDQKPHGSVNMMH